jgi:glycosyltransferase involved in cell wall biosynthesis
MAIKALHIFNSINHSGAEIMYEAAAPIFIKNGFKLYALSTGKEKGDFVERFEKAGYIVFFLPRPKELKLSYYLSFFSHFLAFYKLLIQHKFDVVHIHKRHFFWMYALVSKIARIKTVIRTVHSIFKPRFYRWPSYFLARHFSKYILRVKITSISESVYYNEIKNFWNKTIKLYNWFDHTKFYPALTVNEKSEIRNDLNIAENAVVLITVGSCLKVKNHQMVIKALNNLKSQTEKQIIYLHVGDGPLNEIEKELALKEGVQNNVVFLGNISNVRKLLIASDLFLMPSSFEGIGISALEAMACKIPCIFFDSPGLRDLMPEGSENGLLINPTQSDLEIAIVQLINNQKDQIVFTQNAEKFVKQNFNMEYQVNKMIALYVSKSK